MSPADEWFSAGPNWRARSAAHVSTILGTTIQAADPEAIALRWSDAFGKSIELLGDRFQLLLDQGLIEFIEARLLPALAYTKVPGMVPNMVPRT